MSFSIEKREKGYLLFTITRSETRNAINYDVMQGLTQAISLMNDPTIKALVITGEGDQAFVQVVTYLFFTNFRQRKKPMECFQKCHTFFIH